MPPKKSTSSRPVSRPLRILIADHQALVRSGVRLLLEQQGGFEIAGEASNCQEALDRIALAPPDVALVDVAMPRMDGFEVTRHICALHPATRVLALTVAEDAKYVRAALAAGALGYVPKSANANELMEAIRAVARGESYIHRRVAAALPPAGAGRKPPLLRDLSARETQVLRLIAFGYVHKEVAARLQVSVKTIETHKGRACQKLGVSSRVDIVRLAIEKGWISAGHGAVGPDPDALAETPDRREGAGGPAAAPRRRAMEGAPARPAPRRR